MMTKKYLTLGAFAAMTAFAPALRAADAEIEVEADVDRPKAEAQAELKRERDRERDLDVRADVDTSVPDRDKVKKVNKASGLLGMEIRNDSNEKLGDVKDLVVDLNTGKISYVVMAVGGFLGIGEKLLALPVRALQPSEDMVYLKLNADRAKIEAAPGFAATAWPSVADPEIDRFWGETAAGAPAGREVDRDEKILKRDDKKIEVKGDLDVDRDKKIYTDADEERKLRPARERD